MQVPLDTVKEMIAKAQLEPTVATAIVQDIEAAVKEAKELKQAEATKAPKYAPLILVVPGQSIEESPAFLVEYDEEMDHNTIHAELMKTANTFNVANKKLPIKTFGDLAENLSRNLLKGSGIKLRYRAPAIMIAISNEVPKLDLQGQVDGAQSTGSGSGM